jgi:hypothetical protein
MTPKYVERLITQEARLLARRDSTPTHPSIDQEIENDRQKALELFFAWQDGIAQFQDLVPVCCILQKKVELNRDLLRWEQEHELDE